MAKKNSPEYLVASQFIARDFYVDDGVTSVERVKDAVQLAREDHELCANGGLRLHKFVSNNSVILKGIQASEHALDTRTKDLTFSETQTERALGIYWNIERDCLMFKITVKDQPPTRCGILSTVTAIYAPLGFVAPYCMCSAAKESSKKSWTVTFLGLGQSANSIHGGRAGKEI